MNFAEKLEQVRRRERFTQNQFSALARTWLGTWKGYEYGARKDVTAVGAAGQLVQHSRFTKYMLWLMTDQALPEAGQVSPE